MKLSWSAARGAVWAGVAVLAACGVGLIQGCHDDGDDGSLQARFTAATPAPAPMTLNLVQGSVSGSAVEVVVQVTGIEQFFGAAFHLTFDAAAVAFESASATGTFLEAPGVQVDVRVEPAPTDPGRLLVVATRQGQVAGVDAIGSERLLGLVFRALGPTAGVPIDFGDAASRQVVTCPAPPAACNVVPDSSLQWSGGTLTAN